jgi:hypothetical protein
LAAADGFEHRRKDALAVVERLEAVAAGNRRAEHHAQHALVLRVVQRIVAVDLLVELFSHCRRG